MKTLTKPVERLSPGDYDLAAIISKLFDVDELLEKVNKVLHQARPALGREWIRRAIHQAIRSSTSSLQP